jgi:FkbM family methyltransferase
MKYFFWVLLNMYGRVFGRRSLAGLHKTLVLVGLHGLGYDNTWRPSFTGEAWFVKNILARFDIRVCFDIGAHVGEYSSLLRDAGYIVYAFEPSQSSFERLQEQKDIHAIKVAVSDTAGTATLVSRTEQSPKASLDTQSRGGIQEVVETTTVDLFAKQQNVIPDFVKIDVEGYEREVIAGMTLKPKVIQFEFTRVQLTRGYTVYDLALLLPDYTLYRLLPRAMIPADPAKFDSNIFIFSNYIAIRNDQQLVFP